MPKWCLQKVVCAKAEKLARNADGLVIDDGEFTYCAPGDNGWALNAQQLSLAPESISHYSWCCAANQICADFVRAYLKLPMSTGDATKTPRQSGFLFPELGYGDEDGLSLGVPYYINLVPNFDATVRLNW